MTFKLQVKAEDEIREITTMDLKFDENEFTQTNSVTPVKFKSIFGEEVGVTIAKLKKDQEIDLECIAKKGFGKDHAKWSPAAVANF